MLVVDEDLQLTQTITLGLGSVADRAAAREITAAYREHLLAWLRTGVVDDWWSTVAEREHRSAVTVQEILTAARTVARLNPLPLMDVFVTDRCNVACEHCNAGVHLGTPGMLAAPADVRRACARVGELMRPPLKVNVIGGEPLVHPRLVEIVRHVRTAFPETVIDVFTNGLLVPGFPGLEALGDLGANLQVSIYGPGARFIAADVRRRREPLACTACRYHVAVVDRALRFMDVCCTHTLMPNGDLWYCGGIIQLRLGREAVRGVDGDVVNVHEVTGDELHRFLTKPSCPGSRWCAPDGEVHPWRRLRGVI